MEDEFGSDEFLLEVVIENVNDAPRVVSYKPEETNVKISPTFSLPFVLMCLIVFSMINNSRRNKEDRMKKKN